jgi:uncharacterized protein
MSIYGKSALIKVLKENQQTIKGYGVKKLGIFGSFVRNEQKDTSDIDLLVEFEPDKKNYDNFIGLNFFLEDKTNREIELVTLESLSPYIGPHILKEVEYFAFE